MVLVLTTEESAPEPDREVLFSIDGVDYTIPKTFGPNLALQFVRLSMLRGADIAMSWAMEQALGQDGHAALMAFDQLTRGDLQTITKVIYERLVAALEAPKGGLKAV
jgi:hypothetical protein